MKRLLLSLFILTALQSAVKADTPIYLNSKAPLEERVEDALNRLTTAEKVALCHAQSKFSTKGVPRRVIPSPLDADSLRSSAVKIAQEADIVLFFGGLNKNHQQDCEDGDRQEYSLPFGQERLIRELAAANPNLVVVLISGCAVEAAWEPAAGAIVQAWYCGSEAGHAITDILSGAINPSGKLPISFYTKLEDCGAHAYGKEGYPGIEGKVAYKEDIFVGYRRLAKENISAKFPFGYGLSCTAFRLGAPETDRKTYEADDTIHVTIEAANTGDREGREGVQLYAGKLRSKVARSPRELKAFEKIALASGETRRVTLSLPVRSPAYWNEHAPCWEIEPGDYVLYTGNSSEASAKVNITIK